MSEANDYAAPPIARWEWLALLAIVVLAGVLRMGWPGLTEFKADEARLYLLAADMAELNGFALRGIGSSVGFPNFPMSVWLYSLPLFVWLHPLSATVFTGLLNTLSVVGAWWLTRRLAGREAALAAALLYAASPWAVIYSRKIWAQDLLPLFVTGWGIGAWLSYVERRPRWIVLHVVCGAIAVQTHLAAVALVPASGVLLAMFWRRLDWRWLGLAVSAALLTVVPFLLYLNDAGLGVGDALGAGSGAGLAVDAGAVRYTWMISVGDAIHSLAGPEAFEAYLAQVPDVSLVNLAVGGLILAGMALGWVRVWRGFGTREADGYAVLVVWLIGVPAFFVAHSTPVFPHYFIASYPAQYVLAGAAFAALIGGAPTGWLRPALWGGLGLVAAAQVLVFALLLQFLGTTATPGAFGTPLRYQLDAVAAVRAAMAEADTDAVMVATTGERPEVDNDAATWQGLLYGTGADVRFADVQTTAVFPKDGAVVVLSDPAALMADVYVDAATSENAIGLREGEGEWLVLTVPGSALPDAGLGTYANGLTLWRGDGVLTEDGRLRWRIVWTPGTDWQDAQVFNHVMAGEARVGQADAGLWSARYWRAGDVVVSGFMIEIADESADGVRVGLYRYPSLENVPAVDAVGLPASDAVWVEFEGGLAEGP